MKENPIYAAIVHAFDRLPDYAEWPTPTTTDSHSEVVTVLASALHPRVRSQANGSHYTSTAELPLIPGIDGVGRRADGSHVYFLLPDTLLGALAEQAVIDTRRSVVVPVTADVTRLAAAMNPAMSSWVALRHRVSFSPGESVLILGGTGSAGQLAIQVARHFGAGRIVVAGRGAEKLDVAKGLGADATIDLGAAPEVVAAELANQAAEVDVVLDYLWGKPTEAAIMPMLKGRADRSRLLSWVEIGSIAGPDVALPSAALRQANVHFLGSGQGSVSAKSILETLPALVEAINAGIFQIDVATRALADVHAVWNESLAANERVVFVP